MNSIRIQSKVIGSVKNPNCKFTCLQVLQLLVLFPFFSVKNAANYSSSALSKLFTCHKDMFYRFMNDGNVNWHRKGKNGNWNALLTSDLKLDAKDAFKLYSRRWVIEVAHKEMKQNLKLGKNQCRDFAGQIAGVSLCVLQYNILSYVKRNGSYETIGGLFAEITKNSVELSVAEKIWLLIVEVINVIAETLNCDAMALTEQVISNDKQIKAVKMAFDKLAAA